MEMFKIVTHYGETVEYIEAKDERQALCIYIMKHEELEDVMLWSSIFGGWKIAKYDDEGNYLRARKMRRM